MKCQLFYIVCTTAGDTAAGYDYCSLQPTYVNHTDHAGTYAVTNPIAVSGEYTDVPDLVATAATPSSLDVSEVYEIPQSIGDHYECATGHTLNSSYLYVPTMVSVRLCSTTQYNCV